MKNKYFLSVIAALIMSTIFAHQAQSQFVSYGIKGGLNMANIAGNDAGDTEPRNGFHVGGFLGISLLGIVAAEGGAYYSQKGYITSLTETEVISSYIDVPVVVKFSPLPLFHFFAGPQASFLIDNKIGDVSNVEGMRTVDMALVVGAGINIPMGIRLSAGYDYGFTSLDETDTFEVYNRVIKFTVGYKF